MTSERVAAVVAPARRRRSRTSSDSVSSAHRPASSSSCSSPAPTRSGLAERSCGREHLLDQAGLALDRRVDGAQVPGVEAVALQARGGGHDLHVLGAEAPGLGRDQAELLEAAHELLVDSGGADQLAEARAAGGAGADGAAARPLARALGRLLELLADHAQRQELVALQAQDRAQPLDVLLREQAVAAARALRVQQPLLLEVADLRDRDVGVLDAQRRADRADRQAPAAHGRGDGSSLNARGRSA